MPLLVGGDKVVHVSEELAEKFQPGDQLVAVRKTGEISPRRSMTSSRAPC
jgi:hypothetical protein